MEKRRGFFKILIILIIIIIAIIAAAYVYFNFFKSSNTSSNNSVNSVIENPLNSIIKENTDSQGNVNESAVIDSGIQNFNPEYIGYILWALGVTNLHKSSMGFGNPKFELSIDNDVWSSELVDGGLDVKKSGVDDEDIKIAMSKEEAVKALVSSDIKQYMKSSVASGKTQLELVAGKIELFSKGYLELYKELTGAEPKI